MMKQRLATPLILLSLLAACNFPETATPTPASQAPPQASGSTQKKCGDGVCDGPENPNNCPQDCAPTSTHAQEPTTAPELPEIGQGLMQELRVTNPSSGSQLYVLVVNAQDWDGSPLPTIVIVPGGLGEGSSYAGEKRTAQKIAGEGYTVVVFDPDGRGNSEGTEDKNGHIQQDGLAAVVEAITTNPSVDPDRIGMLSYSFGITMASGTLARHPDLPVRFLIDWEGPANREDTTHGCQPGAGGVGSIEGMADCEDEGFWSQREAVTFIGQLKVPYQRLQSEQDHAQDDLSHAIDLINAAVAGGLPFVRLNDYPPNQTYDHSNPPEMLSEQLSRQLERIIARVADELFSLP